MYRLAVCLLFLTTFQNGVKISLQEHPTPTEPQKIKKSLRSESKSKYFDTDSDSDDDGKRGIDIPFINVEPFLNTQENKTVKSRFKKYEIDILIPPVYEDQKKRTSRQATTQEMIVTTEANFVTTDANLVTTEANLVTTEANIVTKEEKVVTKEEKVVTKEVERKAPVDPSPPILRDNYVTVGPEDYIEPKTLRGKPEFNYGKAEFGSGRGKYITMEEITTESVKTDPKEVIQSDFETKFLGPVRDTFTKGVNGVRDIADGAIQYIKNTYNKLF